MHHFKNELNSSNSNTLLETQTFTNIQKCLRLNDLDSMDDLNDRTHYLMFHMIGLFSFGQTPFTLEQTVDFIIGFFEYIGLETDKLVVTLHPSKICEWKHIYQKHNVTIKMDEDCVWTSDNIHYDYCTEFYYHGIEIGNCVLNNGRNIDVGLGLERLVDILNHNKNQDNIHLIKNKINMLCDVILQLNQENVELGHYKHGFILKKIILKLISLLLKINNNSDYLDNECKHNIELIENLDCYQTVFQNKRKILLMFLHNKKLKTKIYRKHSDEWWLTTHNIPIQVLHFYRNNELKYESEVKNIFNYYQIEFEH